MAVQSGVWGIDVGQCALKALRLENIDGQIQATAFDYVEHPKILSQPDADPDQLTREALETFLSRNSIKGDLIAMSIAGQSGLARFVKLPPVEEKKIADIVKFEAKQQIPFPLEEVVWDFQKIGSGVVTDGFAMDTEIGLFAMKRDMINRFLHHFQSVNVEVHIVQMAPLALCNYVAYDLLKRAGDGTVPEEGVDEDTPPGKKRCCVALDLGTDGSSLIITDGQKIIWQRPIPIGGNHFTRALTKEMKLTFAKAEHLKRNAAKSPDLAKILKALKPVLTDFVNEVQRSLGYFTNTHRDAHIAYMVGLGSAFRLPGLQKFLGEKLSLDVRKPTGFERMTGDTVVSAPVFTENVLSFAVAYGLALQGLGVSRLTTNLLPQEIQFDRKIRAKKPWMVAAAASLLLGLGVLTLGYGLKSSALGNPVNFESASDPVAIAMKEGKAAVAASGAQKSAKTSREQEVQKTTADVRAIVAGKDERPNWIKLNEFISLCVPRPDGSNLQDPRQLKYWNSDPAKIALEQYRLRHLGMGNVVDVPLDDESLKNLASADIEAMFCMYADDLKDFMAKAKDKLVNEMKHKDITEAGIDLFQPLVEGQPKKFSEMEASGSGWVVEIRGTTYHKNERLFLMDTLVYNINKYGAGTGLVPFSAAPTTGAAPADPIKGRVSHAFLYFCRPVKDPQPGVFQHIGSSYVRDLIQGAAGGAGPGMGPMGPGPAMPAAPGGEMGGSASAGSSRGSWQPLGSSASSGGAPGSMGPAGPGSGPGGKGGNMGVPDAPPMGAGVGPGAPGVPGAPGGAGTPPAAVPAGRQRTRYEFVIYFLWREPTLDQGPAAP